MQSLVGVCIMYIHVQHCKICSTNKQITFLSLLKKVMTYFVTFILDSQTLTKKMQKICFSKIYICYNLCAIYKKLINAKKNWQKYEKCQIKNHRLQPSSSLVRCVRSQVHMGKTPNLLQVVASSWQPLGMYWFCVKKQYMLAKKDFFRETKITRVIFFS